MECAFNRPALDVLRPPLLWATGFKWAREILRGRRAQCVRCQGNLNEFIDQGPFGRGIRNDLFVVVGDDRDSGLFNVDPPDAALSRLGPQPQGPFLPAGAEAARVRRYLWIEAALSLCIPIAAAAMARGYGL
jgi:hypothetical protein